MREACLRGATVLVWWGLAQVPLAAAQGAGATMERMELPDLIWVQWGLLALGLFCLMLLLNILVLRRKVAERTQHLRNSEQKLAAILDNAGALVYIKDLDFRYQYANRQSAQNLGCTPGEVIGKTDADLFGAAVAEALQQSDRQVFDRR